METNLTVDLEKYNQLILNKDKLETQLITLEFVIAHNSMIENN